MKKYRCLDCGKVKVIEYDNGVLTSDTWEVGEWDDKGMYTHLGNICDGCHSDRIKKEEWETG